MKIIFCLLVCVSLFSCNSNTGVTEEKKEVPMPKSEEKNTYSPRTNSEYNENTDDENEEEKSTEFEDDTYSADVEYYNPETGTRSSYTLDVEVEDNTVKVIRFSNGGWIDETHISSGGELDEDGTTMITTDQGHEFTITINR